MVKKIFLCFFPLTVMIKLCKNTVNHRLYYEKATTQ